MNKKGVYSNGYFHSFFIHLFEYYKCIPDTLVTNYLYLQIPQFSACLRYHAGTIFSIA